MGRQLMQIPRQSDADVIECFKRVAEEFGICGLTVSAIGCGNIGYVDISKEGNDIETLLLADAALVDTLYIDVAGVSVSYHRGGVEVYNSQHKQKSPYTDELVFSYGNESKLDGKDRIRLAEIFSKELKSYVPDRGVGNSPEQVKLSAIHNATLERLESINEKLIQSTHGYREKLDNEYANKVAKLELDQAEKIQQLESSYKNAYANLDEKKKELENIRKKLDDKDNTHARREIRKDILKEIKDRQKAFGLTHGTIGLRKPIGSAMIILIAFLVAMSIVSYVAISKEGVNGDALVLLSIKQAIYSIGAVGSIVFYIRWMNRWFEQHSLAEFYLKQFELDMERASWLVETSLEWKDAKGTAMPAELMRSLSANLFSDRDEVEHLAHPADQLASALLGTASAIKLQAGDSTIDIDPKKLKRGAKATR